jgi:hypothetical protein
MDSKNYFLNHEFTPSRIKYPFSWVGHIPFAAWIINDINPKIFVELGTHSGNSYFAFCESVYQNKLSTKCYAVDLWSGDNHSGNYSDTIFKDVNEFNAKRFANFSTLLKSSFDDALKVFQDKSIQLLHIDGLHTYEAVKHDFYSWLPKLDNEAIVIFHDIAIQDKGFGVPSWHDSAGVGCDCQALPRLLRRPRPGAGAAAMDCVPESNAFIVARIGAVNMSAVAVGSGVRRGIAFSGRCVFNLS